MTEPPASPGARDVPASTVEQRRRRQRRRAAAVIGVAVILAGVVSAVVAVLLRRQPASAPNRPATAPASVLSQLAAVPESTLAAIGSGTSIALPAAATKGGLPPVGGKPQVLYVGALFCPYCAAERWPLAVALSRFGTLHGVGQTRSTASDYPDTATLDFRSTTLSSDYLDFVPKEVEDQAGKQIESLTKKQATLWVRYTGNPPAFPFMVIGSSSVVVGPSYRPDVLKGLDQQQIAHQLASPTSPVAKAIDGGANVLTAALCKATGGKPEAVCSAPYLAALQARIG